MLFEAAKQIKARLDAENVPCQVVDDEGASVVRVGVANEQLKIVINFFSFSKASDVRVRVPNLVKGTAEKRDALLQTCNDLNWRSNYIKFVLKDDNNVWMMYDLPSSIPISAVGDVARELASRIASSALEAYPELMKALEG